MKYIYIMVLLFCYNSNLQAQNSLTGKITTNNNEPLLADIYFPKIEKGAATELDGSYTVTKIPSGSYTVLISAIGYETVSKTVVFNDANYETITLNIVLNESAIEIEAVILSTPFHKLQSDNVMKVERESINDLNKKGSVTLADGLSNIAGVETITTGAGIGKPVIRGLSSNRVLTYSQGVRLENQQFGDEHGLGINEAGIESVEVIKGPASLLYGSDALGGVLYLNPEKFALEGNTNADIRSTYFSNTLGTATNFGIQTSGKNLKFLARGAYSNHSDYKTGADYRVTNTRFNEKDFKTGLQYKADGFRSTVRYNYNRSNIGIPEEIGEQTKSKDLELPFQEIDNHILSSENVVFLKNSSFDIKAGYLFNDRREFEDDNNEAALRLKLNTLNYDIKYNLPKTGKIETIVGVQGMFQKNENFGEEILIPDAKTVDFGILATSHYHLEKIDFQGGIRYDSRSIKSEEAFEIGDVEYIAPIDKTFNSFTAALGAKYDFSEQLTARLNFASGFRAPNLAELTSNGVHEGTNRYEIGNNSLDNEQNFQTDLALEYGNQHIEIFANGFYNSVNNYIFLTPNGDVIEDNNVFNYVQNDAKLYGGEFGIHLHPHPLDWLHLESSFESVTGKQNNERYLPFIPANKFKNTFRVEFKPSNLLKESFAFVTLESTLDQENPSTFETRTGGYSLLNAGLGSNFTLPKMNFYLGLTGTNITNKSYVNHLSRLKTDGIFNTGRNINLNIKFSI